MFVLHRMAILKPKVKSKIVIVKYSNFASTVKPQTDIFFFSTLFYSTPIHNIYLMVLNCLPFELTETVLVLLKTS